MKLRIKIMAMLIALFSITVISNEASAQRRGTNVSMSSGGPGYGRFDDGPRVRRGHGPVMHRKHHMRRPPAHRNHHYRGHQARYRRGYDMDRRSDRGRYDNDRRYNGNYKGGNRSHRDHNWQDNDGRRGR